MIDALKEFPVQVTISVAWGDMDAFAHVNNAKYFVYFETARIAYFEKVLDWSDGAPVGVGPILAATSCRFRAPVKYPDSLVAAARVTEIGADRFSMEFAVYSMELDTLAATGDCTVVSFDYSLGQKAPIPDSWRTTISELEGWHSS